MATRWSLLHWLWQAPGRAGDRRAAAGRAAERTALHSAVRNDVGLP